MPAPHTVTAPGALASRGFSPPPLTVVSLITAILRRLAAAGRGRVERVRHRRRMQAVREDPAALHRLLSSAARILVVCQGNIIRSACAARMLSDALGDGPIAIRSAGLAAVDGRPCHPTAILIGSQRGLDLSRHAASILTADAVRAADVVFVMDVPQLVELIRRFPEARGRTYLLTCCSPDTALEIADPVDGGEADFQQCFDHVASAVHPIIRALASRLT